MTAARFLRIRPLPFVWGACFSILLQGAPGRAEGSTSDLAVAAQNLISAMYSLPFQNNTYGGAGRSHNQTANVLNIQPVLSFTSGRWNIISRTIAPLIYVPGGTGGGLDDTLTGSGKLSIGPAAVVLVTPKPWVIGTLVRQLWSVAGPSGRRDVDQLSLTGQLVRFS
jgi:hypothetical protein